MAPACAQRLLPIPRGAGQLGSLKTLPVADRTLLAARPADGAANADASPLKRMTRLFNRWLIQPRLVHPYPSVRFDAMHPR